MSNLMEELRNSLRKFANFWDNSNVNICLCLLSYEYTNFPPKKSQIR